jgi:hypothetical protein
VPGVSCSSCVRDSVVLTARSFKEEVLEIVKRRQLFLIVLITWKGLNGSMILDSGVSDVLYLGSMLLSKWRNRGERDNSQLGYTVFIPGIEAPAS